LASLYTIGHSTRSLDELVASLLAHGVATLVDIRAFPVSRRMPHFNRESLELELPKNGIGYVWMKELGGRRKKILQDSPNTGLRNDSFRNYADYMLTEEFGRAVDRLLTLARTADPSPRHGGVGMTSQEGLGMTSQEGLGMTSQRGQLSSAKEAAAGKTAIMCAERVYFQCHRMLVSDYLVAHGHEVLHIDDDKHQPRPHKLMAEAHLVGGQLLYNAQELF